MNRTGKKAADIFGKTTRGRGRKAPAKKTLGARKTAPGETPAEEEKPRGRGRPAVHTDEWQKVTTILFNRNLVFLDRLALEMRQATGKALNLAEVIRALLDALEASGLDVSTVGSEEGLRTLVIERLG